MLFNNFVEGSLKLKIRFDVYITYSEKTKNKNEGIRILPANCSIDRKILLNFFVPFSQIQVYKSTSSRITFNSPKILQLPTYHVPYTLLQLLSP